ncbi:MAG: DUF4249 domain-containing protein [Flavobacteriaceae bacterium]
MRKIKVSRIILLGLSFVLFVECTEPVVPEFDFKSGLVSVEGFVSTAPGGSFVKLNKINEIKIGNNSYENVFLGGAEASFINTGTGEVVALTEDEAGEIYVPPTDFAAKTGDAWELEIILSDGKVYKSLSETLMESVPITGIGATYKPEHTFHVELNEFVPGHSIEVDFDDPQDSENFYYWSFRSFELKDICVTCYDARIYRNDTCILIEPQLAPDDVPFHTYTCSEDCWRIRYGDNINIFSDRFSNGLKIDRLPVAEVLLYSKKNVLIEIQQLSLSASAYEYYETLKDIANDNGGFNSPPSAALIGNMYNPDNPDEYVLGRFTAASTEIAHIFLEREHLEEEQIVNGITAPEGTWQTFPEPPEGYVFMAPCQEESRYNTGIKPEGWPD